MRVSVSFYSYFKELTGCSQISVDLPEDSTIEDLFNRLVIRFPKLQGREKSTLIAVGIEYQNRSYVLKAGDEVSLFPPVQGG